jgi:transposase-like protein
MSKVRPPYPAQFRQQMVELVRAGPSPAQLSREFGVTAQSITNWVGQTAIEEGLTTAEREELLCQPGRRAHRAQHLFQSKAQARMAVFIWIEGWYNPRRRHSGLGYLSPLNFERSKQALFDVVEDAAVHLETTPETV